MINLETKRQIAEAVAAAEAQMEFSTVLHPTNEKEQREQFVSGTIEEPTFTYRKPRIPMVEIPDFSRESKLDALYRDRVGLTKSTALLLESVGDDEKFSALSQSLFPVKEVGGSTSSKTAQDDSSSIDPKRIVRAFEEALESCGISDWTAELTGECSSRMFVNQWTRKVFIRSDISVTEGELATLLRHEIGVHVLRFARGSKQREPLLHIGTFRGRLIEEGVACYIENSHGHPRWYRRHRAVETALHHSFRETWQTLRDEGCNPEEAWTHTLRAKRGLSNGASHGAFTRDALYAQGYEEVCRFVDGGGDLLPMLSAPIHHEEAEFLRKEAQMNIFPLPDLLRDR